jgi:hypothetical protein
MRKLSKEAIARWAQRAAGYTSSQAINMTRVLTNGGIYLEDGAGAWDAAVSTIAICGANVSQAADAVLKFAPMQVKTCAAASDPQLHLRLREGSTLAGIIADMLCSGSEEILSLGLTLTIMSNPAEAQISLGVGEGRRVYTFSGPADDRYSPSSIRSAKIVPAHVFAELSDMLHNGEAAEIRRAKVSRPNAGVHL